MERIILHSDMNNFYASVEGLYQPALQGKPIAVAGDSALRHGVVLAKNDHAKRFGVQTGDALWQAKQKCREIVFVPPHYDRYQRYSQMAQEIYASYTSQVEPFGLDECWLDVTASTALFGGGEKIAGEIRRRIRQELGVTASVGVSFNKVFAKLGSDLRKPDATTVIPRSRFRSQVWPLPVETLLYAGRAAQHTLGRYGIYTIGQLAGAPLPFLEKILGKHGRMLWSYANGFDGSPVLSAGANRQPKSIGNSATAPRDLCTEQEVKIYLCMLCESVTARLRANKLLCGTVQLTVRDNTLQVYERQEALPYPSNTMRDLWQRALALFYRNPPAHPVRSLGVRACNLRADQYRQLSLLPERMQQEREICLERTLDKLRGRFGPACVRRGVLLLDPALSKIELQNGPLTGALRGIL